MIKNILFLLCFLSSTVSANELFTSISDFSSLSATTLERIQVLQSQASRSLNFVKIALADIDKDQLILSFGDKNYLVFKTKFENKFGKLLWEGEIEGDLWSYVSLVQDGTLIVGSISAENRRFELRYLGENIVAVVEPESQVLADDGKAPDSLPAMALQTAALGTDDGDTIDVMVLYTSATRAVSGSSAAIEAQILAEEAYANNALARSCANFRYRVVHMAETPYVEVSETADLYDQMDTDLNNLTYANGIDANHTLRDTYAADLVQLWTNYNNDGLCGLAWVGTKEVIEYYGALIGFSVIVNPASACADVPAFAHELGHNVGLSHDRYTNGDSMEDYSLYKGYGFLDYQHKVASIMSYGFMCADTVGESCIYVPYFSNPNIIRDGTVFGKAGIADGVGYMNENAINVARFKNEINASTPDLSGCTEASSDEGLTSCFVATAAYGSFLDEHVKALRHFRDSVLLQYSWGRSFVAWYYEHSPYYADIIAQNETLRVIARVMLAPVVYLIMYPWIVLIGILFVILYRRSGQRSAA